MRSGETKDVAKCEDVKIQIKIDGTWQSRDWILAHVFQIIWMEDQRPNKVASEGWV